MNLKSRPLGLANSLHDELTGSYEFTMNIHGEEKKMTEEEVRSYRQHTDRSIREEAYRSLRRVYNSKQNQIALGNIYTSIVKDWSTEIQMRKYGENVMAQRNLSEEMDDEVVDMLLAEVQKAYPIYARFLRAKAKMLGLLLPRPSLAEKSTPSKEGEFDTDGAIPLQNEGVPEGRGSYFSVWDT